MPVEANNTLVLPELSAHLGLKEPEFLVKKILRGGMGQVCKITHISSGGLYALKILNFFDAGDDKGILRFLEELKLWSTASSCDGVVETYGVFRINEFPCICAKWMTGGDMRAYLSNRNPSFFFKTIDRVIGALEWVYDNYKIIHRDLKPDNILLDDSQLAFVSDWGLGRVRDESSSTSELRNARPPGIASNLTGTGQFIGTIAYSSPEQILGSRDIDHRTDIYSLGCWMFEWETGRIPFEGSTREEIAYLHIEAIPPKLDGFLRKTVFGVESLIANCLQKSPSARFQDYSALRQALHDAARSRGVNLRGNYAPERRFSLPLVGAQEIRRENFPNAVRGTKGLAIIKRSDSEPYIREAATLSALGEWSKAKDILLGFYIPEMFREVPDDPLQQGIAVNLAQCLTNLGKPEEAILALNTIAKATDKPPEYFVNLSFALLKAGRWDESESAAQDGLRLYRDDRDLLGNLTLALVAQSRYSDAKVIAERRLSLSRDVHSLEELAHVHSGIGNAKKETDYPEAVKHFGAALRLLYESKSLNARYLPSRFNLAKAWFDIEDYVRASGELNEIMQLPLSLAWGELCVVRMAECMNRVALFEKCCQFCETWLERFPDSIGLQRIRAETLADYNIGKFEEGTRIVERDFLKFFSDIVMRPDQRTASDFRYLARIKEWMGEVEEAFSLLAEAEKLQPGHWEVPFDRASIHWGLQEFRDALSYAEVACGLGPWCGQTWRLLSAIQQEMGLRTKAVESERRAGYISETRKELSRSVKPN